MKTYQLSKQKNIRDLGGFSGYNGKTVKFGRLYRGGALSRVSEEDKEIIKSFGLTDIVDFRSTDEYLNRPDYQLENVSYHNFPPFQHDLKEDEKQQEDGNLLWFVKEGDSGFVHLLRMYKEMVDSKEGQEAYRNFFKILLSNDKPVVYFHCSQGKDRAGLAAYFIESALGVDYETIKQDYLLSNIAMKIKVNNLIKMVENKPFYNENYHKSLVDIFSAKLEYLEGAVEVINSKYGGVMSYLKNVLNVDIDKLRKEYLE